METQFTRREFVKSSALLSCVAGISVPFKVQASGAPTPAIEEQIKYSACLVNCGSRCPLKVHVRDGVAVKISTEDGINEAVFGQHQIRPCLRGRAARWRVYHADRIKYPMVRVGRRGEGKFKRISWDEATTLLAEKLRHTIDKYGNEAIYYQYGSGTTGANLQGRNAGKRLLSMLGGFLDMYGSYSTAQISAAQPYLFGGVNNGSYFSEVANSDLVVMFGQNLAETRASGGGQIAEFYHALAQSKAKVIIIDPRHNDSVTAFDAQWIPIRPGTDAALVAAMGYTLIKENLIDDAMLNKYCIGWDDSTLPDSALPNAPYKSYLLGLGQDKIAKTPEWASELTGIPVETIRQLARRVAGAKAAFITQGWGLQRTHNGEQAARAVMMLPLMTGQFGRPGTNIGAWGGSVTYSVPGLAIPNPLKVSIPTFLWTEAILRGPEMTATRDGVRGKAKLDVGIKFLWNYASNITFNQHADLNRTHTILEDESLCEFIVVFDNHMTPSAKYADLLLPDVTALEADDLINNSYASGAYHYVVRLEQAIAPLWESRLSYDVFAEVAEKMGIGQQYTEGRSYQQWLRHSYDKLRERETHLPKFAATTGMGVIDRKVASGSKAIALKDYYDDPIANPLKTPSGKIEIYSQRLANIAAQWQLEEGDIIEPIPSYAPAVEGVEQQQNANDYPLQMIGFHTKGHCHSTYPNVAQLAEVAPDVAWINPITAADYAIKDGDLIEIFNARGRLQMVAKVTQRIIPAVVAVPQGAWARTNKEGVDIGGCINRLTMSRPSPLAKGNPQHTNLVEIKRISA